MTVICKWAGKWAGKWVGEFVGNVFCADLFRRLIVAGVCFLLVSCASVGERANELVRAGMHDEALQLLQEAVRKSPDEPSLRMMLARHQEGAMSHWIVRAEQAVQAGDLDAANTLYALAARNLPTHPRVRALRTELDRIAQRQQQLREAWALLEKGDARESEALVNRILSDAPNFSPARQLKLRLREIASARPEPVLGPAYHKPVNLEFRDAPLRQVMETLARNAGVNFIFDNDVKGNTPVTVQLRGITLDEALRIILATNGLDRQVLNDSTLLIHPQTKSREYLEQVTRTFYITNADIKQAANMLKLIAKVRDMHVDERLGLIVVRDSPAVIGLAERLIASIDLAEPEVMLEVEVMEISSTDVDKLGLQWPAALSYGLESTESEISSQTGLRGRVANPAFVANFRSSVSKGNTLANPRLRARNREKARVMIGEKLPVFNTTATANVGVATSTTYLDVGLKLEVEPAVLLDNDVVLRISLEVSSVTGSVTNGQGSTAYQVGTRQASSVIRLHDGETQVLAGLIRDDETRSIAGLPGLLNLPLLGRLFGTRTDEVSKKELVLFITPRVIRNVVLPDAVTVNGPAGMELNPGANSLQIQSRGGMQTAVPRDNNRGGGFGGSGSYPGFPTAPAPSSPTSSPFDPPVAPAVPLSPQIRLPPPVGAEATQARP